MRKIFNKMLAGVTTVALVATLLVGINVTNGVKAEDTAVTLGNWSFSQGGMYNPNEGGNEGYIGSVSMNGTGEMITGWLKGNKAGEADPSVNQTQTATQLATGFSMVIENTGWDAKWADVTGYPTNRINPWSIQAKMADVAMQAGHTYTVSFKARASKNKFVYVTFDTVLDGVTIKPYEGDTLTGDNPLNTIGTTEKTYTYTFTNWVSGTSLSTTLMLGAFDAQYDFDGNDVSNIITAVENMWAGTVVVSDFSITDNGVHHDFETEPKPDEPVETTVSTENPTTAKVEPTTKAPTTVAPTTKAPAVKKLAQVNKVKAKNNKKKALTITWKKVKNAKKYQVKVGSKSYNTSKVKIVVKKLKKGKKYTVRVRAKASGYKTGAWSKKVKVKIKK